MQPDKTEIKARTAALFVSMISAIFNSMGNSALNVALPAIGREFSMGAALLGWVAMSMILSASVFVVPFGRLADIYGRKKVMIIGTLVYTASCVLSALSRDATVFIISRVLQGFGAGMIFGTSVAILTSVFPPEKRGWALGWNVSAVYIGLSCGPFIGGIFTATIGWRYIFWLNLPLGIISFLLLVYGLKGEWQGAKGDKFDLVGSLILGVLITAFIYGLSVMPSIPGVMCVAAGIALLAVFVAFEKKTVNPVIDVNSFLDNPVFAFSNLATLIHYSAAFSVGILMSLYLQYIKGFDPRHAGLILMAQPVVMAIFAPVAGRISDRTAPGKIAAVGMTLTMAGLFLLSRLGAMSSMFYIIICLVFVGFGFAFFSSPNSNAVMSAVDKNYYGVASGIISTMRQAGQMIGLAIATMMISIFIGKAAVSPENQGRFLEALRMAFLVSSALCFFGIFASLARKKTVK